MAKRKKPPAPPTDVIPATEGIRPGNAPDGRLVYLLEYEITEEPFEEPSTPWPASVIGEQESQELFDGAHDRMYERFPDYLFAKVAVARRHMEHGRLDQVEPTLGKLDLKLMYPHRTRFHVSEAAALWGLMGEYLLMTGRADQAEFYYKMLTERHADHPVTKRLEHLFEIEALRQSFGRLVMRRPAKKAKRPKARAKVWRRVGRQKGS